MHIALHCISRPTGLLVEVKRLCIFILTGDILHISKCKFQNDFFGANCARGKPFDEPFPSGRKYQNSKYRNKNRSSILCSFPKHFGFNQNCLHSCDKWSLSNVWVQWHQRSLASELYMYSAVYSYTIIMIMIIIVNDNMKSCLWFTPSSLSSLSSVTLILSVPDSRCQHHYHQLHYPYHHHYHQWH